MPLRPTTHQPRPDDDRDWWRELVGKVLDQCPAAARSLDRTAYFEALYAEFVQPGVWALFPEVHDVLLQLRPHFRLGLISNFDGRLRPILAHLGLEGLFDPMVISSEVGADKPDPWIFQHALALAGTTGAESLHVGDDPSSDWAGAANAGLRVFRLQRPENSLRDLAAELLSGERFTPAS